MEYISFCFSSKFYKKVWDKVFPGRQFDKPKAKKIFYQYIYSSNSGYQWEDKVSISQAFPTVSDFFHLLKHPDYVLLSHIMQRLESIVMIEVVSRRIAAEKPGIPIFTIHDSIATLPEEVDYIKQVIKEEFKRYLDLNVKLGRENWY
jgi:hypothetical protein